tara:strand:- start:201 stop:380 length:180 start_codon:yes stop_codon:yes gene_type:complete
MEMLLAAAVHGMVLVVEKVVVGLVEPVELTEMPVLMALALTHRGRHIQEREGEALEGLE